jgi:hypothetical protein
MAERSANWIKQVKRDLEMAKNARGSGFYEWACFIAQQAAEKGVKTVYQSKGYSAIGWNRISAAGTKGRKGCSSKRYVKSGKEVRWSLYSLAASGWNGRGNAGRSFR